MKAGYGGDDAPKAVYPSVRGGEGGVTRVASSRCATLGECVRVSGVGGVDDEKKRRFDRPPSFPFPSPQSVGALGDGDKRKLLAGSQALNFRRDGMEVRKEEGRSKGGRSVRRLRCLTNPRPPSL